MNIPEKIISSIGRAVRYFSGLSLIVLITIIILHFLVLLYSAAAPVISLVSLVLVLGLFANSIVTLYDHLSANFSRRSHVTQVDGRVTSLVQHVEQNKEQHQALMERLEVAISTFEAETGKIQTRLDNLEIASNRYQKEIEKLRTEAEGLRVEMQDFSAAAGELRSEIAQHETETEELQSRVAQHETETEELQSRITQHETEISELGGKILKLQAETGSQTEKITDLKQFVAAKLKVERSQRIANFARRDAAQDSAPKQYVIIVCNPRSGSTWLMDMLRSHPRIYFSPSADTFEALGLEGYRYPTPHLAERTYKDIAVEVLPGIGEYVKKVDIAQLELVKSTNLSLFGIEKIHPSYFHFDVDTFLKHVDSFAQQGATFRFILLVRDPRAAITSYGQLQQRHGMQTQWEKYLQRYIKSYRAIATLQQYYPEALTIAYQALYETPTRTLQAIYTYLWPEHSRETGVLLSQAAVELTERQKQAPAPFFGSTANPVTGAPSEIEADVFQKYSVDLEAVYAEYNRIVKSSDT